MKKIAIVTINYNSDKATINLLSQLYSLPQDFEYSLYVVDNSSGSSKQIDDFIAGNKKYSTEFLKSKENLGFSGGCNLAIKVALSKEVDYVLIINNDTIINKTFLKRLVEFIEKKGPCIVSPKIYFAKGYEFHKRYKKEELGHVLWYAGGIFDWKNVVGHHKGVDEVDRGQYDKSEEVDFASGCCMLVSREIFEKVGMFNEDYFLYYEDADLSLRSKKKGYGIYYCPESEIWHMNAGSAGGSGSDLQDYYITRNRMLFGMKYASFRTKMALLKEGIMILTRGRKWQKKGVQDFYLSNFYKGSFPLD